MANKASCSTEVQKSEMKQNLNIEPLYQEQPSTSSGLTFPENSCHHNAYIRTLLRQETHTSDEDFDSDDSLIDKDYIPPKIRDQNSDTDSDSYYIPNSQQLIVPETPEKSMDKQNNTPPPTQNKSLNVNNNTVPDGAMNGLAAEPVSEPVTAETVNLSRELPERSNLTKKGTERKRKRFESSLEERKKQKVNEKILKKYSVKPGCEDTCRKTCKINISEDRRQNIHDLYWLMT